MSIWRVGTISAATMLNVYEGARFVCVCEKPEDAKRIVDAMNDERDFQTEENDREDEGRG